MLNFRHYTLVCLAIVFVLIFSSAASAQKRPAKKPVATKNGQAAPKLKPAMTGKAKTAAKQTTEPAVAAPAKTETAKNPAVSPNPVVKKDPKENPNTLAAADKPTPHDEHLTPGASPNGHAGVKPAATKFEVKEKETAAATTAAKKTTAKKAAAKPVKAEIAKTETAAKTVKAKAKKPVAPVTVAAAEKPKPKKEWVKPSAPAKPKTEEITTVAKEPAKAPAKNWLPPVTTDKIRADLTGKTIADIPSEETGDGVMDWQFAANQPKEIDILRMQNSENERTVEVRIAAKRTHPNLDGSYERVRGMARLHYERGADKWELLYVENLSLKHGDTGAENAAQPARQREPDNTISILGPPPNLVPGHTVNVIAGQYSSFSFNIIKPGIVDGRFQASGGAQNDIETYILDENGFLNWVNNHGAAAYYNSGRLTAANIQTPLGPGTYYLVFNNRFAPGDNKTVEANIILRPEKVYYPGDNAINTVTRTYAPSANPVQPYIKPEAVAVVKKPLKDFAKELKVSEVAGYSDEIVLSNQFQVASGGQYAVQFSVNPGGVVRGNFDVIGGGIDPLIETYIMTAAQYQKWSATHEGVLDYSSGRATGGRIERSLNPGNYYLVFSNRHSRWDAKTIHADVQVEYLHR